MNFIKFLNIWMQMLKRLIALKFLIIKNLKLSSYNS